MRGPRFVLGALIAAVGPVCALLCVPAALLASMLAYARPAQARACRLGAITVTADSHAQRVAMRTSCIPRFSVLRLHEPERVVIDLTDVDAESDLGRLPVHAGVVEDVDVQAILGPSGPVARVVVSLRGNEAYDIVREGQDVSVVLQGGRQKTLAAPLDANGQSPNSTGDPNAAPADINGLPHAIDEAGAPDPTAGQARLRALLQAPAAPGIGSNADAAADALGGPSGSPAVPAVTLDAPVRRTATFLGLRRVGDAVRIELAGEARYNAQQLEHPKRFVVDLPDASLGSKPHTLGKRPAWLARVRLGKQSEGIRLVFDLKRAIHPAVHADDKGLLVRPEAPHAAKSARGAHEVLDGRKPHVSGLHFDEVETSLGHEVRIYVTTSTEEVQPEVDTSNPHAFVLALPGLELPGRLEKGLDTRASKGPVSLVSSFQAQRHPPSTHIVVSLKHRASQRLQPTEGGLCWVIRSHTPVAEAPHTSRAMSRSAGYAHDAVDAGSATDPINRLANKRISLDVKDAEVANVLRLISEETGENIIASDEVHGKVTLKLRNVPAEQALDTLLRVKGFDRVRSNNILRIASADTIQKERDAEVARKRALVEVEEVTIKMVTINYATASEVVEQLKPMLSGRGSVQVDGRTNTIILQDITSNISNLADLARRLDKQTPLVNIQARIVEADSTFVRDLGVQWGGAVKHTAVAGNPTGLYFPADVTAQGAADFTTGAAAGGSAGAVVAPSRYAVNLPASLTGSGAALGFIMGSAGGSHLLDLRLSAMETNGNGKVISSPEVSTLDNRTARVSQGVSFAVSTVSAAGTNVKFIPAVLELEVTPHVTNDGTVLLKLHVQKSAPDFTNRSGSGDPSIQTKEAQTEVLVKDGDTSVIGGILTRNTSETSNEVPFLSKIPILGHLFREHSTRDTRSELLVFITPRIINRDESRILSDVAATERL